MCRMSSWIEIKYFLWLKLSISFDWSGYFLWLKESISLMECDYFPWLKESIFFDWMWIFLLIEGKYFFWLKASISFVWNKYLFWLKESISLIEGGYFLWLKESISFDWKPDQFIVLGNQLMWSDIEAESSPIYRYWLSMAVGPQRRVWDARAHYKRGHHNASTYTAYTMLVRTSVLQDWCVCLPIAV